MYDSTTLSLSNAILFVNNKFKDVLSDLGALSADKDYVLAVLYLVYYYWILTYNITHFIPIYTLHIFTNSNP